MLDHLKIWARQLKSDIVAIYFAARDPRCPWAVRVWAMLVAAYALSPIDLIPDFIPVLGYLDDLLIVPAGLWLAIRWTPPQVLRDARARAAALAVRPRNLVAAACFVLIWLLCLLGLGLVVWHARTT